MQLSSEFKRLTFTLLIAVIAGASAGAVAGWTAAGWTFDLGYGFSVAAPEAPRQAVTGTRPLPEITVIPIERNPTEPILPPSFADRRISSLASVYRRTAAKSAAADSILSDDRLLGQAVALTTDGWFVAPHAVIDGLKPAELLLWHNGRSAAVSRVVHDRLSAAVFMKTELSDLPAAALVRLHDVAIGLPVWFERREFGYEPQTVVSLGDAYSSMDGISSESIVRTPVLNAAAQSGDLGAAVWAANGSLVGSVVSVPGSPARILPATAWAQSFQSLLASGESRHAQLGARSLDLSRLRLESATLRLPARGAWLRDDRRQKKPAVDRGTAAADAGLKAGDVIQKIDRDILDGSADLAEYLAEYKAGSQVTLTVLRGDAVLELPVTLGSIVTSEEIK